MPNLKCFFLTCLVLLLWPTLALADGMAFDADTSRYQPLVEREQVAAIAYQEGREKMVLAVNLDRHPNHRSLWIFPVPGTPQTTHLNLIASFPEFEGHDPKRQASFQLESTMALVRASQLYPLFLEGGGFMGASRTGTSSAGIVSQEINRFGVHSELIYASSPDDLIKVLRRQHVILSADQILSLTPYLNGHYTLVGTWLNPPSPTRSVPAKPATSLPDPRPSPPKDVRINFDVPVHLIVKNQVPLNGLESSPNVPLKLAQAGRRLVALELDKKAELHPDGVRLFPIPNKPTYFTIGFPSGGFLLYDSLEGMQSPSGEPLSPGILGQRDNYGLHTELIKVRSASNFAHCLGTKYQSLNGIQRETMRRAIAAHQDLFVCWITNVGQFQALPFPPPLPPAAASPSGVPPQGLEDTPCVSVEFTTSQAFFPLKPTHVYGDALVPARLYVLGDVQPITSAPLASAMRVSHYQSWRTIRHGTVGSGEAFGIVSRGRPFDYTLIEINATARNYTDDLHFVPVRLWRMQFAGRLYSILSGSYGFLVVGVISASLSYLCAGMTGLFLFRRWRDFAILGLWNLLSLIGVIAAMTYLGRRDLKYQRNGTSVAGNFSLLFSLLFFFSTILLQIGLTLLL